MIPMSLKVQKLRISDGSGFCSGAIHRSKVARSSNYMDYSYL